MANNVTIPTLLTSVVDDTTTAMYALSNLIQSYIQFAGKYVGIRSLGAENVVFPCFMVEPMQKVTKMDRLGKYRIHITFMIYFYVVETNQEAIIQLCNSVGETMEKLFSNNALNDLNGANTSQFKQYPNGSGGYYWLNSEMTSVRWSRTYINAVPTAKFMRAGVMTLDMENVVIK